MDNDENNNNQEHSEEGLDMNNAFMNNFDQNNIEEGEPAPNQYDSDTQNLNAEEEINNNDINELDVDLNENDNDNNYNLDGDESQEGQLNNQDLENENNLNEEGQDYEEEEIDENNNMNEMDDLNLNVNKNDMNYNMNDNMELADINNMNDIDDNIDTNLQGNFDENNMEYNEGTNLDEMVDMQQNEEMANNNDFDFQNNMNNINNEENYNNNLEPSDVINDENYENMNDPNNIKNNEEMNMNPKNINLKHMKLNQGFDAGYVQEDEGFINQDINNENIINNNNNEIMNQKLMEHINEINQRFYELEKEFKFMEKQNKELKMKLKYEQLKNKELKPSDIKIYENSINQGKIFLEDIKKKNTVLKKKISELEEQKNTLDYKLIEANQKIKRYERDYNINDNKKEENKNNNDKEQNNEILSLKNKIDEYEIANSKLTLDNNNLKKKIENMEEEHNKQIKLITDYKNSELTSFQKVISQYKEYFKNHNINPNVNIPPKNEKNSINANNNNSTIDYEKIMLEMTNKDKLIKSLSTKMDKYISEYKEIIEEKQLSQQKYNHLQFENQKLLNEKNDLVKKNQNLLMEINSLNQKIELTKTKYKNNKYIYDKNMLQMNEKLGQYKQRVITLKLKIKEMLSENQQGRSIKQNSNINVNKSKFNNFLDIKQIPLTPTQKKKFPGMSQGKVGTNKMPMKESNFNTNKYYMNKNINNNF